jgi:hypothetical protein
MIDALCFASWEKKKKRMAKGFFPRAGHVLLAVLHGIFPSILHFNITTFLPASVSIALKVFSFS